MDSESYCVSTWFLNTNGIYLWFVRFSRLNIKWDNVEILEYLFKNQLKAYKQYPSLVNNREFPTYKMIHESRQVLTPQIKRKRRTRRVVDRRRRRRSASRRWKLRPRHPAARRRPVRFLRTASPSHPLRPKWPRWVFLWLCHSSVVSEHDNDWYFFSF